MGIEHHALPDGFAERLEDIADEVALLVPNEGNERAFTDRKREIQRKLWAMAQFPYPVEG
jgi:hypothetical protein